MRTPAIAVISSLALAAGLSACSGQGAPRSAQTGVDETAGNESAGGASAAVSDLGPAIGAAIPANFAARDSTGAEQRLADLSGANGLVLVFTRSADWCPYCQAQMVSLRDAEEELATRGYALATISYDPPATLAEFGAREEIGYTMLSDQGSRMIDAFGLRDPQYEAGNMAHGVPYASIFVIGADGMVRAKMISADYTVRPDNAAILAAVEEL